MFGMMKQPKHQCRECLNCNKTSGYGAPVCYELGAKLNGRTVATKVELRQAACRSFKQEQARECRH